MQPTRPRRSGFTPGFTLVELLIVILIIVVLISILIPTVSRVRIAAWTADTKNQIRQIEGAVERYYGDQHEYPGPLSDVYLQRTQRQITAQAEPYPLCDGNGNALPRVDDVTQEENLVLGLFGGLKWMTGPKLCYDPQMVGRGMMSMNPNQPKKFAPYIDDLKMLSPYDLTSPPTKVTYYSDNAGSANDSPIPEIIDKYPNSMPILYLRAHPGKDGVIASNNPDSAVTRRQYDLSDVYAYTGKDGPTGKYIGEGKKIRVSDYVGYGTIDVAATGLPHGFATAIPPSGNAHTINKNDAGMTYVYPYDAWAYFRDPGTPYNSKPTDDANNYPRAKDRFILISAGPDRVYGTDDDICSFGDVHP